MNRLTNNDTGRTFSVSPENYTGDKGSGARAELGEGTATGAARDLGKGWKVNPYCVIEPQETFALAHIEGQGIINHIWITNSGIRRYLIIRMYWDGETEPSVEAPLGDFFASATQDYAQVNSLAIAVNPGSGLNSYWQMPFRKGFRITLENLSEERCSVYYQIDGTFCSVAKDALYFNAYFHRENLLAYKTPYTLLPKISGRGKYAGTYMLWGVNSNGWWGEGEIKFFIDGDEEYPTVCGTGTEDYFGGSYNFENPSTKKYECYSSPYSGMPYASTNDNQYSLMKRFGLYRWHITDPIYFSEDLHVTIQALGWRSGGRYLPLTHDISSVVFWYQLQGSKPVRKDLSKDYLEIV